MIENRPAVRGFFGAFLAREAVKSFLKKRGKATYIYRSKKIATYQDTSFVFFPCFYGRMFGPFVTRGVQRHGKKNQQKTKPIGAHKKNVPFCPSVLF
jgi:hypothetical protein